MTEKLICPVCEEGKLTRHIYSAEFEHTEGPVMVAGLECYQCDKCDADPILEDQIKRNHVSIADAKRRASGRLTRGKCSGQAV